MRQLLICLLVILSSTLIAQPRGSCGTCPPTGVGETGKVLTSNGGKKPVWAAPSGGSGWSLTGNAGTNPATDFIGTTDAQPLNFRVNDSLAGFISNDADQGNTFFGAKAGLNSSDGFENVGIGSKALYSNVNGFQNVAIGNLAMGLNDIGTENVAVGYLAMTNSDASAAQNTSIGTGTLLNQTSAVNNTAVGYSAGANIITGSSNVFIGSTADASAENIMNSIALGAGAIASLNDQFVIGTQSHIKFLLNTPAVGDVLTTSAVDGTADWKSILTSTEAAGGADATVVIPTVGTLTFTKGILTDFTP